MKMIDDMFAMRYRMRTYEKKEDVPYNKVIKEYRFTVELVNDDELKEMEEHLTDLILCDENYCTYAVLDASDPLDWERGDVWRKECKVWYDKMWHDGKDIAKLKGSMSMATQAMIKLYDEDEDTRRIWDMVVGKIYGIDDAANAIMHDDIRPMIEMTFPAMISKLAEIGSYSCDWRAVARHIKEVNKDGKRKSE